jgi:charged multivesicular body protein 6
MGLGKSKDEPPKTKKMADTKQSRTQSSTKNSTANRHGGGASSSGAANEGISDSDRATLMLKLQRDKLHVVLRRSATVLAREVEQAKYFMALGQRDKALYCLKKKKLQESQMEQVEAMLSNVQSSLNAIDMARIEASVLESLKQGTKTLQDLQKGMSPEEVEKVMDEAFDAIAVSKEVTELLTQQVSDHVFDDDELLAELMGPQARASVVNNASSEALEGAEVPSTPLPVAYKEGTLLSHNGDDDVRQRIAA